MVGGPVVIHSPRVWDDAWEMTIGGDSWSELADQYGVDLLVLSTAEQATLIERARRSSGWTRIHEDEDAEVFSRYDRARKGQADSTTRPIY